MSDSTDPGAHPDPSDSPEASGSSDPSDSPETSGSSPASASAGFLIADETRVGSALDLLARRVDAELGGDVCVVGILRRGAPLARALGRRLAVLRGEDVAVGALRLERYADDLTVLHDEPRLGESDLPFDVEGASVLLVDDVIYSGRTFLKAVTHLGESGARAVHLAALCSRGGNEVPVHADFVAMHIDVGEGNVVEVHAPPYEETWAVRLLHREDVAKG